MTDQGQEGFYEPRPAPWSGGGNVADDGPVTEAIAWYPPDDPRARGVGPPPPPPPGHHFGTGPPQPPPSPSTPPSTPAPAAAGRRGLIVALVAVALLLVAGVTAGVVAAMSTGKTGAPAAGTTAAAPAPVSASASSAGTSDAAPTPAVSTTAPPSIPSPAPVTPAGVDVSAVLASPYLPAVIRVFNTYFTGINTHNPALATSVFDPAGVIDPGNPSQVAGFGENTSTTQDTTMLISGIAPTPSGLDVAVTFTSTQAADQGPGGDEPCTNWSEVYHLTPQGAGYLILRSDATHSAC